MSGSWLAQSWPFARMISRGQVVTKSLNASMSKGFLRSYTNVSMPYSSTSGSSCSSGCSIASSHTAEL